ncbi:MAG: helix-turn-helix domain-containing protein [Planctomycetes bacterium]|nr:helix-turn-helix domain-containing protein [Planctomycetota bacterium]
MEQKFVKMEDAIEKLGISADRLNELREHGQLRAYRDGTSWKFRTEEIEKMVLEGVPDPPPASDFDLVADVDDLVPLSPEPEESSLEILPDDEADPAVGSELELDNLEDTVTAGASDLAIAALDVPGDSSDSILLSEEELGESVSPAGSTIIGKSELEAADADLELSLDDDGDDDESAGQSDVRLASSGASDVLSSDDEDALELEFDSNSGGASAFEDLEELEIDLAAESSRILGPDDITKARAAAGELVGESDLSLDDSSPLAEGDSNMGSTDVPLQSLESAEAPSSSGSGSEIELSVDDDDLVLGDTEGSDITLESGDSGINLAPVDSGLALDDIPLEMGGSAILSSLDLGATSDPEISLVGGGSDVSDISDISEIADEPAAELQVDDDFQLTPLSEGAPDDDGDSSSQVIALDAGIEGLEDEDLGDDVGVLDDVGMTEDVGDGVMLADDFSEAPADGLGVGAYAGVGGAAAATEVPYSVVQIVGLGACVTFLALGGVMMMDMVRHIWSWNEPYTINSTVIDAILNIF